MYKVEDDTRFNQAVQVRNIDPIQNLICLVFLVCFLYLMVRGDFNKFPEFFVQAFKIVVDSWKFTMLLLYVLWDDWPIFMISASNQQLQQELEYTILKSDCHNWWISKMQSDVRIL